MNWHEVISERASLVDASGIRKMFELAAGLDNPIDFSIGQPDFDVPDPIKRAAIRAIEEGFNGYTITQGIEPLRRAIAEQLAGEFGDWHPSVLITSGVSGTLLLALMVTVNPGDEVLLADPYFVQYTHLVRLMGGVPVAVDSYPDFRLPVHRMAEAITERSKILILNSPSNPTGVVYGEEELRAAAELAEKHDLLVISDEIYNALCYDGPFPSIVRYAPDRTLLMRGFSKTYGMTGWRLAYAAGPEPIIQEMAKLQQYTFVCAPSIVQRAGVEALKTDVSHHIEAYRRKRDIAYETLREAFEVARPSGGFYIFPKVPAGYACATQFVAKAITRNILIIPGAVFSERDSHFRISYATDDDTIRRGCELLCELAGG